MSTSTAGQNATANLNTVLLTIALAVLAWIGHTTQQTSVMVAVFAEKSTTQQRELLELRSRVATIELQVAQIRLP